MYDRESRRCVLGGDGLKSVATMWELGESSRNLRKELNRDLVGVLQDLLDSEDSDSDDCSYD